MKARILFILTAISTLTCIVVAILWIRSFWVYDHGGITIPDDPLASIAPWYRAVGYVSSQGGLMLYYEHAFKPNRGQTIPLSINHFSVGPQLYPEAGSYEPTAFDVCLQGDRFGFGFAYVSRGDEHRLRIVISDWSIVAATLLFPAFALKFIRRRMVAHNSIAKICPDCGYDLRASKDRCPECGHMIESADSTDGKETR